MLVSVSSSDSIHNLSSTKRRLSKHALFLLRISSICLCVTRSLLSLRSYALSHVFTLLLISSTIVYESVAAILAGADTGRCDGSRPGLHYIVGIVIYFKGRLFYLFHLYVQLIRQLLQLSTRIRSH